METDAIVINMCTEELTEADRKAICNTRGFSITDAGSPALFKNLLLSDRGLESAFSNLNHEEIIMLHLLKCVGKPVDITVFERLTEKRSDWFSTFHQQYGDVFKHVRKRLIRNGVLMFASDPSMMHKKAKLERLQFVFPEQHGDLLPSPFASAISLSVQGEWNDAFVRAKLRQILDPVRSDQEDTFAWRLKDGTLLLGEQEFSLDSLERWREQQWALFKTQNLQDAPRPGQFLSPMSALKYAFSLLDPNQWIVPDELKPLLEIFCGKKGTPNVHGVLQHGWDKACLVRHQASGKTWYRPARAFEELPEQPSYGHCLRSDGSGRIRVDLDNIPVKLLETLSRMALFGVEGRSLMASPGLIRMGRVFDEIRKAPLSDWLLEQSQTYSNVFHTVSKRWGRRLIHHNLMFAKVKNIRLKVILEKSFKNGDIVSLPGDVMAFPKSLFDQVQALVIRNGFAVKVSDPSSKGARNL